MGTPATFGADSASGAVPQFRADVGRCLASTVGRRQSGLPRGPEPKAMNHAVGPTIRRDWVRLGSEKQGAQPQATGCNNPTGWGRSWFPISLALLPPTASGSSPLVQRRHMRPPSDRDGRHGVTRLCVRVHGGGGTQTLGGTHWAVHKGRYTMGGTHTFGKEHREWAAHHGQLTGDGTHWGGPQGAVHACNRCDGEGQTTTAFGRGGGGEGRATQMPYKDVCQNVCGR